MQSGGGSPNDGYGWFRSRLFIRAAAFMLVAGAVTLGLSFILGIDSVRDPRSGREVGFAHSPNWTANLLMLVPLAGVALAWLAHALHRLFASLRDHSMLLDTDRGAPVTDAAEVARSWRALLRGAVLWLALLAAGSVAMSAYEVWHESYHPLFELGSAQALYHWNVLEPEQAEPLSWVTAALASPPETVSPAVNFAFDILAWSIQAFGKILSLLFYAAAVALGVWLVRHGLGIARMRLIPDLRDADPRLGYQRFELSAGILFGLSAISVLLLWLVVVQNLYLANEGDAVSLWDLVFTYGSRPLAALLDTGTAANYDVFWARRAGLASVFLVCVVVGVVLPIAMRSARAYALEQIDSLDPADFERRFGVAPEQARPRLRAMPAWPYRFVGPLELVFLAVLGVGSLWFFRVAPYALLTLIVLMAIRGRSLLRAEAPDRAGGRASPKYLGLAAASLAVVGALLVGRSMRTESAERGFTLVAPRANEVAYRDGYDASHALLIGIGYEGSKDFPALPNAERDVTDLESALLRTDPSWSVTRLAGKHATHDAIMDALGHLARTAGPDDRIFIFFAGHAVRHRKLSGWILPADARPETEDAGRKKMIRFTEFTNFFWDTQAKHVLVALDCCYSGRATRGAGTPDSSGKYLTARSHVVIASGRPNERASDGESGGNSPFARAFLDALDEMDAVLTVSTLYGEIQRKFGAIPGQTPQIDYQEQDGQFLFLPPDR